MAYTDTSAALASKVRRALMDSGIPIWESVATAAVVSVLSPLIGGVIGVVGTTIVGTVVGVPAGRVLESIFTHGRRAYYEIIYGEGVIRTLETQLIEQFRSSSLSKNTDIALEMNKGFAALRQAHIEPRVNWEKLNRCIYLQPAIVADESSVIVAAAKRISEIGWIRIKVPAIHPAAVAAFKRVSYLVNKFGGNGTRLVIDCSSLLGIELLHKMGEESDHDFLFIANSPFYLWDHSNVAERYHPIFTVCRSKHLLICKRYQDAFNTAASS